MSSLRKWGERFLTFVNLSAKYGPYAKATRGLHKEEIEEAMADITWRMKCQIYNRQTSCSHRKGGKTRAHHSDHAVTTHTFIDSRTRIKCVLCGLEAWSNSGQDFKFAYMQSLAKRSTNWPSSSEQVLLEVRRGKVILATFPNTDEGRAALRKRFPNWNGKYGQPEYEPPKQDENTAIPEGHSPIKGVEASTPEPGPEDLKAIVVTAYDDLLYSGSPYNEGLVE